MTELLNKRIGAAVALGSALGLGLTATVPALAQTDGVEASLIDQQLINGVDLRTTAFEPCLEATSCTVDGVKIEGFQLDADGAWQPHELYWDPIDGIGVAGSGQNDEIDYDEQLVITATRPLTIRGVWLSDLFVGEGRHYGAPVTGEDAETGRITLTGVNDSPLGVFDVSGDKRLPNISFNTIVDDRIEEGGDLLSRLIVDEDVIRIVAADHRDGAPLSAPRGEIDPDKQDIFAGVPTVERDDASLLALIDGVILFAAGTSNAETLSALAEDPSLYATLYKKALTERAFSDENNGEVAMLFQEPVPVTRVTFSVPLGTSNDFSVAGFVVN